MAVTVRIPTPLRSLTKGQEQVSVEGSTVRAVIEQLEQKHPGLKERLLDEKHPGLKERLLDDKGIRRFVNLYLGDEDVRFLEGLETPLQAGAELSIIPAIAGG